MEKIILIRVGELFLKGNNRHYFVACLKNNILAALKDFTYKFSGTQNRMYVEGYEEDEEEAIIKRLSCVFGISSLSPAVKVATDEDALKKVCDEISPKKGIFRVTVNRADNKVQKRSMDIARDIGGYMLSKEKERKVDLFKFDFEVNVDIRENGFSYVFYKKIPAQGGLPVGCGGNGMLLLSGGIDSPVAAYRMAKRGVKLFAVHFHSFPYTSELAKEKVITLAKKLVPYCGEITLFVVPFTDIQYAIKENCPIEYMITIMRRFMMRIAERIARNRNCGALITGESLGQVASQTMESINVTNSVVTLPVFRPLIGMDKTEIIETAQSIGTFDTSILPYEDCCTVFLPKNPVIKPKIEWAEKYEERIKNREELTATAIQDAEILVIR